MYPKLRLLSLLSIFSLTLISLTGCGEKRIHVATVSGAPGDELALEPITDDSEAQATSGLNNASIDESALSPEIPDSEGTSVESIASDMDKEPINMVHKSRSLSSPDGPSESILSDAMVPSLESEFSDNNSPVAPLAKSQDFSAQSSSTAEDHLNPYSTNLENFQEPATAQYSDSTKVPFTQDSSSGPQDTLAGEDLEPIPDTFKIAKAEPSDSLQDRMNQIKKEELAAAAAGLEDVFFQFDSWTLTEEGKQALQRTLGWFEQDPSSNLIIEGHADQRGTQAYNMVLAKKRAVAVQDYLSQLGIDASRMAVISYGKDKPFCQDATEVCYQLNRRGHLLLPNQ
jgi:peptidoglycan-associated lipoprotein